MAKKNKSVVPDIGQEQGTQIGMNDLSSEQNQSSLFSFRAQVLILSILGFLFYWNTFQHEAAFDDAMAISENEYVQRGVAGIPDIMTKDAFQSYIDSKQGANQLAGGRYRPLSLILFAVEQQVMGVAPDHETTNEKELRVAHEMHARHVVNVLLYILSVIVLLIFLRKVVFKEYPLAAFITAVLFIIHPIHTEVVANVKSCDEILSVLFIGLTFIMAFRYRDDKRTGSLVLSLFCFFLALLSKEYAVTLLVLLPLSFYLFCKKGVGQSIKSVLPFLIPFGIYVALRFSAVSAMAEGAENNIMNNPYLYASGAEKLATELMVMLDYLKLLFFPSPLSSVYTYNSVPYVGFSNSLVWLSIAVYAGLIASMCVLVKRRHVLGFAIAFYLVNLLLVSNLLFNIGAFMGERLIYHSSVGFCMVIGYVLFVGYEKIRVTAVANAAVATIMVVLIVACGYKTMGRNKDWKNDETLFLKDVQTMPTSILANNNAAAACMLYAKQTTDTAMRKEWFEKAIGYFDKVILLYPMYMNARLNRGLSYFDMGQPDKAIPDWDTVRKYSPEEKKIQYYFSVLGKYYYHQGIVCGNAGKTDSAAIYLKRATEAVPGVPDVWYALAKAYHAQGNETDARYVFEKAEQLKANAGKAQQIK